jgi:FkbM family methyltransferase
LRYRIFPQFGLSYLYGGWEPEAQGVMIRLLKKGGTAYDIGANYGMHALLMARLVGPSGRIYAFEPVPSIFRGLKEHVEMNRFRQVECVQVGVWDRTGKTRFYSGDHLGAGHCAEVGETLGYSMEIETVSLDDFVFEKNHHPPDFIKIDVEGAEGRVLSGARRVLETYHPVLLIDLHNPEQDVAVGTTLMHLGYQVHRTNEEKIITNMVAGWPDANGMWGQIVAVHHTALISGTANAKMSARRNALHYRGQSSKKARVHVQDVSFAERSSGMTMV